MNTTKVILEDGSCGCLDSLVRHTEKVKDDTIFTHRLGYGKQDRTQGIYDLLLGDLNQARVCTKFPGHVRPSEGGKPQAVLFVQVPL